MTADLAFLALIIAATVRSDSLPAAAFVWLSVLQDIATRDVSAFGYYFSAAAVSSITVLVLSLLQPSRMGVLLADLCVASAVANAAGYVIWYLGLSPSAYNYFFMVLYAYAVFIILTTDRLKTGRGHATLGRFALARPPTDHRRGSGPAGRDMGH